MFTMKRGICTNKGDNLELIFERIVPLFAFRIFGEILVVILIIFLYP